jgi:transposase
MLDSGPCDEQTVLGPRSPGYQPDRRSRDRPPAPRQQPANKQQPQAPARQLRLPAQEQTSISARERVRRCAALWRELDALERELAGRVREQAPELLELPGCGTLTAAKLIAEIAGAGRFRSDARLARHAGVATAS